MSEETELNAEQAKKGTCEEFPNTLHLKGSCENCVGWISAAASLPEEKEDGFETETKTAIAIDRAYLNGMQHGWNLGITDDRKEYDQQRESRGQSIRNAAKEAKR
jgi:hypothetical protein